MSRAAIVRAERAADDQPDGDAAGVHDEHVPETENPEPAGRQALVDRP